MLVRVGEGESGLRYRYRYRDTQKEGKHRGGLKERRLAKSGLLNR